MHSITTTGMVGLNIGGKTNGVTNEFAYESGESEHAPCADSLVSNLSPLFCPATRIYHPDCETHVRTHSLPTHARMQART
jgi:hypothetical protein